MTTDTDARLRELSYGEQVREAAAKMCEAVKMCDPADDEGYTCAEDACAAAIRAMPLPEAPKDELLTQIGDTMARRANELVLLLEARPLTQTSGMVIAETKKIVAAWHGAVQRAMSKALAEELK